MNWIIGAATVLVSAVGLWLANGYRRQISLKLGQTRLEAYSRLWVLTGVAAPVRLEGRGDDGCLRLDKRRDLWAAMTDWYYANGDGMLLTETSKEVYLNVKHDLVCAPSDLLPAGLDDQIKKALGKGSELDDKVMGALAIRLFSLLRTQLKSDLAIYGPTYARELHEYERFFLRRSKVDLRSKAWATAAGMHYRWWRRLRLPNATDKSLEMKPHASLKSGLPQPSPLKGMSPVLSVGEIPLVPPSSRAALDKALSGGCVDSAQADTRTPKVLQSDCEAENHPITHP